MLTYKNDPLLLDKETANELIKSKRINLVLLDKKILNLYSAFVKKEDFIDNGKIAQPLQRMIYAKVSDKLLNQIKERYNKKDLKKLIESYTLKRSWIKAVDRWFKKKIIPILLLRLIAKDNKELANLFYEIEYLTDFLDKSRFYPPKTLNSVLNPKIIYLTGCSLGDGHIDKKGKRWTLVDGTSYKEKIIYSRLFVEKLGDLLKSLIEVYNITTYKTKFALEINNKTFCRFLNFFFGLPTGKKKYSILKRPLILNLVKKDLEKYFWRGCFDTDGSINKKGALDFCSIDENLIKECSLYLKRMGFQPKINNNKIILSMHDLKKFGYIGLSHPRKQREFLTILKRGPKYLDIKIKKDAKKINQKLLKIYKVLRFDNNGYRTRIHYRNLIKEDISRNQIKKIIRDLFGYNLKTTTKNLMYFKSKKVYDYLNNLFILEPSWEPIGNNEETKLLDRWNEVWY